MKEKILRYLLSILFLFISLNAFGGGYYGMSGAKGVPIEWLENSPFQNYFIPSLFLFIIVGGSSLLASIFVFRNLKFDITFSFLVATIILTWIITQVSIIGYVSWMQPTIFIIGLIIFFLSLILLKLRKNIS
ncbi:MAG: hypothetical protein IPH62_07515 [Ignavibacteriae bacterium]|nr:hypothetical protein [Ignavibacteriota bacterium]